MCRPVGRTRRSAPTEDMEYMKELRKFGFQLGLGLNILGCIMFYRYKPHFIWFSIIGSFALALAIIRPALLVFIKKVLDLVILSIGRITNVVTLVTAFYLIFTPIAIILKLFRKDLLHQRIDKRAISYWTKRREDVFSKQSYERMG